MSPFNKYKLLYLEIRINRMLRSFGYFKYNNKALLKESFKYWCLLSEDEKKRIWKFVSILEV